MSTVVNLIAMRFIFAFLPLIWIVSCQDTECPPRAIVQCSHEPCLFSTCEGVPDATCTNNYCRGCNAIFTDSRGNKLSPKQCYGVRTCSSLEEFSQSGSFNYFCTDGDNIKSICFLSCPQGQTLRRGSPVVRCRKNGKWHPPRINRTICVSRRDGCPLRKPRVQCPPIKPCSVEVCPAMPNATCTNDHCGQCRAVFTDSDDNILSRRDCTAGQVRSTTNCSINPCSVASCPGVPRAVCRPSRRGTCVPIFRNRKGRLISRAKCNRIDQVCSPPVDSKKSLKSKKLRFSCTNGYRERSTCVATCRPARRLRGPSRITCQRNGSRFRWNPTFSNTRCV